MRPGLRVEASHGVGRDPGNRFAGSPVYVSDGGQVSRGPGSGRVAVVIMFMAGDDF